MGGRANWHCLFHSVFHVHVDVHVLYMYSMYSYGMMGMPRDAIISSNLNHQLYASTVCIYTVLKFPLLSQSPQAPTSMTPHPRRRQSEIMVAAKYVL